jgi:hypothetical protein
VNQVTKNSRIGNRPWAYFFSAGTSIPFVLELGALEREVARRTMILENRRINVNGNSLEIF